MRHLSSIPTPFKASGLLLGVIFLLASCSSTKSYYDEDGIYSNSEAKTDAKAQEESSAGGSYFKNYFEEEAEALKDPENEDLIFTDVDSYSSEGAYSEEVYVEGEEYQSGRSAWGDETDETIVNVYNNGFGFGGFGCYYCFNRFGFGFNRFGFGFSRFGFGGFGYPYYGGLGFGFGGFGFGFGGFGYPYYGGFFGSPFYYGGFGRRFNGAIAGNSYISRYGRSGRFGSSRGRQAARIVSNARKGLRNNRIASNTSRNRSTFSRSRGTVRPNAAARGRGNTNRGITRPNGQRSRGNAVRPSTSRSRGTARPQANTSRSRGNSVRPRTGTSRRPAARRSTSRTRPSFSRGSSSRSFSRGSSRGSSRGGSFSRGGSRGRGRG